MTSEARGCYSGVLLWGCLVRLELHSRSRPRLHTDARRENKTSNVRSGKSESETAKRGGRLTLDVSKAVLLSESASGSRIAESKSVLPEVPVEGRPHQERLPPNEAAPPSASGPS